YRVHERPEPARVLRLVEQLASLGVPTPGVPDRMSPSQAAELMGELSQRVERYVRGVQERRDGERYVRGVQERRDGERGVRGVQERKEGERHVRGAGKRGDGERVGPWGGRIALTSLVLRSLRQ